MKNKFIFDMKAYLIQKMNSNNKNAIKIREYN